MPNFKVIYNGKPKRTEQISQCNSFQELQKAIYQKFEIKNGTIKFIKPPKNKVLEFFQNINNNNQIEINILGTIESNLKQKTEEQIKKQQELKKKQQEYKQNYLKELQLNKKKKPQQILSKLKQKNIQQRGMQYINSQTNKFQDLGADYICAPIHLLRNIKQFRQFCNKYKYQQRNPFNLLIEQLKFIINETSGLNFLKKPFQQQKMIQINEHKQQKMIQINEHKQQKMIQINEQSNLIAVNPMNWISSWITYCTDIIQFPYSVYDLNYVFNSIFDTIRKAENRTLQNKSTQIVVMPKYLKTNSIIKLFVIQVNILKKQLKNFQEQKFLSAEKYLLQCDLSQNFDKSQKGIDKIIKGIKKRFERKELYQFDGTPYLETIVNIEKLPQNLIIHCNRFGYSEDKIKSLQSEKKLDELPLILDLSELCGNKQIYKYKLKGIILHKGKYYHNHNKQHSHDCVGQFITIVEKQNDRWQKFNKADIDQYNFKDIQRPQFWNSDMKSWIPVILLYNRIK